MIIEALEGLELRFIYTNYLEKIPDGEVPQPWIELEQFKLTDDMIPKNLHITKYLIYDPNSNDQVYTYDIYLNKYQLTTTDKSMITHLFKFLCGFNDDLYKQSDKFSDIFPEVLI